jgi:4-amino-4-deoxy-L-arabinose transferase-like glycosyltransferase
MNELRLPLQADAPFYSSRFFVRYRQFLPWLGLIFILLVYLFALARLHPTNFFGQMEDDSLYFSSAREIARGHGYIVPNLPGTPPATKYPILYPWILSWVWRLNPSFPDNLSWAVALNAGFGVMFLTASFVFLRRLKGLNDIAALILTGFCAIHPVILALSANLMSDIPFAAFTLAACILASKAIETTSQQKWLIFCGILSGLSMLLRTLGLPIAFGLFVAIGLRAGWRKSFVFAGSVLPFLFVLVVRSLLTGPAAVPVATSSCGDSWRITWLYYTSYTAYWKADVLSNGVCWEFLKNGIWAAPSQTGSYFVDPTGVRPAIFAIFLLVFLSGVSIRGLFRQAQVGGWQPVHLALGLYVLTLLVWDYANFERFLIPFLPLIAAGMWIEALHLISVIRSSMRRQNDTEARIAALFFCLLGFALLLGTAISWRKTTNRFVYTSQSRGALLEEKKQAYAWLRTNTSPNTRVLAYEDASSFLYSDRITVRPTIFLPAGYYRPEILQAELSCMISSAGPTEAKYWIVADDDFSSEWEPAHGLAIAKEREMEASLPLDFRSTRGHVRVYKLGVDE